MKKISGHSSLPTLDLTMADLIARYPAARPALGRMGMACVGCAMAKFETVGEAAIAYGFDPAALLARITHAACSPTTPPHRRGRDGRHAAASRHRPTVATGFLPRS
jgi:hybrid cluster-associated redox disulfide protein